MAAQENHIDVVKYLLENGANQSTATEVRRAALTAAFSYLNLRLLYDHYFFLGSIARTVREMIIIYDGDQK